MLKVGLTGGIACGKSTVARMLERKGALLIDADLLAREAVEPDQPAFQEIVSWLGDHVVTENGMLDREKIAHIVFNDSEAMATLNSIVHSRIHTLFKARSRYLAENHPSSIQVWDVPLLFESGMHSAVHVVVVVASSEENQLTRLSQRNGFSRDESVARIRSQMPMEEKIRAADYVVENNSTEEDLQKRVDALWETLIGYQQRIETRLFYSKE